MKILITGASGLVGKKLIENLQSDGHQVLALVRSPNKLTDIDSKNVFPWQYQEIPDPEVFSGVDAVVHLLGESVAEKRWTKERKVQLRESRIVSTRNLVTAFSKLESAVRPKVFVSASATGFYGNTLDKESTESSPMGNDFLSSLCGQWEDEANKAKDLGIRVVNMRLGLVLSKDGGFLSKMMPVILGNGMQWLSWVHIQDVLEFVKHALADNRFQGPYNVVSPQPVTNRQVTEAFAKKKGFPLTVSAPAFVLKTVLGEMSAALLDSQRVLPKNLILAGYQFQFSTLDSALNDIYGER